MTREITIPAGGWKPRPYQEKLWRALEGGTKRAIAIWNRRAGKDEVGLQFTAVSMMQRPGNYWYCCPSYSQARKAIWTAVNPHSGRRRIDEVFPQAIRATTNEQEMFLRLKNNSTFSVIGSDQYDALVGSPPLGICFSEWSRAVRDSFGYLSPILVENNGWAVFLTTPLGANHCKAMYDMACKDPTWFAELQTVADTKSISLEAVEQQRREYVMLPFMARAPETRF
jgi:phage terminase large subunit